MKYIKPVLFFIFATLTLTACDTTPVTNNTQKTLVTQAGEEVDKKFVDDFEPKYLEGMKYTYISTTSTGQKSEYSTEILGVTKVNNVITSIKVRLTTPQGISVKEGTPDSFNDGTPEKGIIKQGTETVSTNAGEFKGATVVAFDFLFTQGKLAKSKVWLVTKVGAVKRVDVLPDGTTVTTELKEFTPQVEKTDILTLTPKYKAGMIYTYSTTDSQNVKTDKITEITSVDDKSLKLKITENSIVSEKTIKPEEFIEDMPDTGILNQGKDTVTVSAGTYKDISMYYFTQDKSPTEKQQTILWVSKDTGVVKRVDRKINPTDTNAKSVDTLKELKEFKQ